MDYSESAASMLGGGSASAWAPPPAPEQPISAKLTQSLTLAESLAEQVTRIADGVTGPRPLSTLSDNAKAQAVGSNLSWQADALSLALTRLSNQVDRLNSAL